MKTSAISSRYLARGSFDGSLNLTCFPQSPRLVLHESPKEIPRDLVIVAAMKSHARRGNGARPRDPRSARRFSCRRLRYGVPSLSLSLSFSTSFLRRFALDLNGTCTSSESTRFTAFLLPPSLASCRAILFNFVEAPWAVKRLQRVNVVSLSWCVAFTSETFIMLAVVVSSRCDDYVKLIFSQA